MTLEKAAATLVAAARHLDTEILDGAEATRLFGVFTEVENTCAAARVQLAARIEATGAWAGRGCRSPEEWVARVSGGSLADAKTALETGARLHDLPATAEAFRSGGLSLGQAATIAEASRADPAAEAALLEVAERESLRTLKDKAREVILASRSDLEDRYARQLSLRSFRHGLDDEGMVWGRFRLPPDTGAALVNTVEREADRQYRAAYKQGRRDGHDVYAADALIAVVTGQATRPAGKGAEVVVHVSRDALLRDRVDDGEICMVEGFGPVPPSVARRIMGDAFLKGVLVDGTRVQTIRHFGRRRPATLDTALRVRSVLEKGDVLCDVCGGRDGIEWDHTHDFAKGGRTEEGNMRPMCRYDHDEKTAGRLRLENGVWFRLVDGVWVRVQPP